MAGTFLLGCSPPVENASRLLWDGFEAWLAPKADTDRIRLVVIDEQDYEVLFESTSPLPSNRLAILIASIVSKHPKKLIVDLETAHVSHDQLLDKIDQHLEALRDLDLLDDPNKKWKLDVVWARGRKKVHSAAAGTEWQYAGMLAEANSLATPNYAIPLIPIDRDGRVRRSLPCVEVGNGVQRSLASVAAAALNPTLDGQGCEPMHKKELDEGNPIHFTSYLKDFTKERYIDVDRFLPTPAKDVDLKNKVVFLGGNYSRADTYYMADGKEHPGVEVLAAAAMAMADEARVREIPQGAEFGLKLLMGGIVSYFIYRFSSWLAIFCIALTFGSMFGLAARAAFSVPTFLPLVAFILGILIDALFDMTAHAADLEKHHSKF